MDGRQITACDRESGNEKPPNRSITETLEGGNGESEHELADRGVASVGDYAVLEIAGKDHERVIQILRELEQWIVAWANKEGADPIFRWRVGPR